MNRKDFRDMRKNERPRHLVEIPASSSYRHSPYPTSSSYTTSRRSSQSSRSRTYGQGEIDEAYQSLCASIEPELFFNRYKPVDDQDRPLPNVWEGVDGLMQHLQKLFPMPKIMKQESAHLQNEHLSNERTSPEYNEKALKGTGLRLEHFQEVSSSLKKENVKENSEIKHLPGTIHSKKVDNCTSQTTTKLQKQDLACQSDTRDQQPVEMRHDFQISIDQSSENQTGYFHVDRLAEEEQGAFLILDTCGEVDVLDSVSDAKAYDKVGVEEAEDDLMIAFMAPADSTTTDVESGLASYEYDKEIDGKSSSGNIEINIDKQRSNANPVLVESNSDEKNTCLEDGTNTSALDCEDKASRQTPVLRKIMFHQWDCERDPKEMKRELQDKYNSLDTAIKNLGKRYRQVKFDMEAKSPVTQSNFLQLGEIGRLLVGLFCEMEALRLAINHRAANAHMSFPAFCSFLNADKKMFQKWHSTVLRKVKSLSQTQNVFISEGPLSQAICQFNLKSNNLDCIRLTGMPCFHVAGRFKKYLIGKIRVYEVSEFLKNCPLTGTFLLNDNNRKLLSEPDSPYCLGTIPNTKKDKEKDVFEEFVLSLQEPSEEDDTDSTDHRLNRKTVDQSYNDHQKNSKLKLHELRISNPYVGEQNTPCQVAERTAIVCADETASSKNRAETSKSLPRNKSKGPPEFDIKILEQHEDDPGFCTQSYIYYNQMVERWKLDVTHVKARILDLTYILAKDRSGGPGSDTIRACVELAQLSSLIKRLNSMFDAEKSSESTFLPNKVKKEIGKVASNYLRSKFNSIQFHLRRLLTYFTNLYCKNFEAIHSYNNSVVGLQNGKVVLPGKVDTLRRDPERGCYINEGDWCPKSALKNHQTWAINPTPQHQSRASKCGMEDGMRKSGAASNISPKKIASQSSAKEEFTEQLCKQKTYAGVDPADKVNIHCKCGCGGIIMDDFPSQAPEGLQLSTEAEFWMRLSLVSCDVKRISSTLDDVCGWFNILSKAGHKKAARGMIDICATLPLLAAGLRHSRRDQQEKGYSEDIPFSKEVLKTMGLDCLSHAVQNITDAEKELCQVYTRFNTFFKDRQNVMTRFHPHSLMFHGVRKQAFIGKMREHAPNSNSKSSQKTMKKKNKKKGVSLKTLGAFSSDDTSKEKIAYYQKLLRVQKQVSKIRKSIKEMSRLASNRGAAYLEQEQQVESINSCDEKLKRLEKEMVDNEVYKVMYGKFAPRYIQSLLKVKRTGKKKTVDNHIYSYDFILKMIGWGMKELRGLIKQAGPNNEKKFQHLEAYKDFVEGSDM